MARREGRASRFAPRAFACDAAPDSTKRGAAPDGSCEPATTASDVYALGIILYELAVGEYPYEVKTPYQVILAHATQQPRPSPKAEPSWPGYPECYQKVVLAALAKKASERPSVSEIRASLAEAEMTMERARTA